MTKAFARDISKRCVLIWHSVMSVLCPAVVRLVCVFLGATAVDASGFWMQANSVLGSQRIDTAYASQLEMTSGSGCLNVGMLNTAISQLTSVTGNIAVGRLFGWYSLFLPFVPLFSSTWFQQ